MGCGMVDAGAAWAALIKVTAHMGVPLPKLQQLAGEKKGSLIRTLATPTF